MSVAVAASHQPRHHQMVHQSIQGHGHIGLLITRPHDHVHVHMATCPHIPDIFRATNFPPHGHTFTSTWPHVHVHLATGPHLPGHKSPNGPQQSSVHKHGHLTTFPQDHPRNPQVWRNCSKLEFLSKHYIFVITKLTKIS